MFQNVLKNVFKNVLKSVVKNVFKNALAFLILSALSLFAAIDR